MQYGHVTNGAIDDGPRNLPKSWGNISGLNNLSDKELLSLGWMPWVFVKTPVGPNQIPNGSSVAIKPTEIVETELVRDMTPQEVKEREDSMKDANKREASNRLQGTDWVELSDVSDPENPPYLVNKADFTAYRAEVRAIVLNPPVTVSEWPVKPDEVWA
jgi:hypothetical protein